MESGHSEWFVNLQQVDPASPSEGKIGDDFLIDVALVQVEQPVGLPLCDAAVVGSRPPTSDVPVQRFEKPRPTAAATEPLIVDHPPHEAAAVYFLGHNPFNVAASAAPVSDRQLPRLGGQPRHSTKFWSICQMDGRKLVDARQEGRLGRSNPSSDQQSKKNDTLVAPTESV